MIALALVTISVVLGLMMAGRLSRRPGANRVLSAIHEQTAVTGLVVIAIHGLTLLGDPWLNPGPKGIALPFLMDYRPLWTGFGIIAGWLAAVLGLSFYVRKRIGPRLWRKAHRATIVVYALGVAHTLGAGTDAASPFFFWPVVASAAGVGGLFVARIGSSMRRARRSAPRTREGREADAPRRRGRRQIPRVPLERAA